MRARGLFLSMAISAVWLMATSSAWATFPGTNGRIAFAGDTPKLDRDVFTLEPDGSGTLNVTGGPGAPAFALEPDYSPDGTKIAFRSGPGATAEIYTANADGTGFNQLTSNSVKDYTPAWSPDGSMIAFASNRNDPAPATCIDLFGSCEIDIFVMPATGGSPVQVTFEAGTEHFPQFSPDGRFHRLQPLTRGRGLRHRDGGPEHPDDDQAHPRQPARGSARLLPRRNHDHVRKQLLPLQDRHRGLQDGHLRDGHKRQPDHPDHQQVRQQH